MCFFMQMPPNSNLYLKQIRGGNMKKVKGIVMVLLSVVTVEHSNINSEQQLG